VYGVQPDSTDSRWGESIPWRTATWSSCIRDTRICPFGACRGATEPPHPEQEETHGNL
jgi:hypothetical protein